MEWWNAILPVVTLALGWVGSVLTEGWRDARAARRAVEARADERREVREGRRESFELQVLLDLFPALHRQARATTKRHIADWEIAKTSGQWYGAARLEQDELSIELMDSGVEVRRLAALVLDDNLRNLVLRAQGSATEVSFPPCTMAEAEARWHRSGNLFIEAQESVGARIRHLYHEDPS